MSDHVKRSDRRLGGIIFAVLVSLNAIAFATSLIVGR